jgi:hypothetical protein
MIGSAVDMARAYMAEVRLQSACDSAALAGRRMMEGGVYTDGVRDEAERFFIFNFPDGIYGSTGSTVTVSGGDEPGVVQVAAAATLPTGIMHLFGYDQFDLQVNCEASQNLVNTDVLLVLDVTGSMAFSLDEGTRIEALRDSVMALYAELEPLQEQLENVGLRLRIGIVPYSSTVNVGKLVRAQNANFIRNPATYRQVEVNYVCTSWRNGSCRNWSPQYSYPEVSVNHSANWFNNTWTGCIEERDTVATIDEDTAVYDVPSNAFDLQINTLPTNAATRWKPYDPAAQTAKNSEACPREARRLRSWTESQLQSYIDSLNPVGGTYHDIGMIWGARFISNGGIFAADNPNTFNDMPVARHIIFMTDGQLEPNTTTYSAYGTEVLDQRITGGNTGEITERHHKRFQMACNAARSLGADIWVVAIGSGADDIDSLEDCADSNLGEQVFTSDTRDEMIDQFAEIGKSIGALRLTQ